MQKTDNVIDAFHLPLLEANDVAQWHTHDIHVDGAARTMRWPQLTAAAAARMARDVRNAGAGLRALRSRDIVAAIDQAVASMRADVGKWTALCENIAAVTGYSREMALHVVDRMAVDWRTDPLMRMIDAELGSADVLDGFVQKGNTRIHAAGPLLSFHIFSGNVPGVAVTSIVRALIVKSAVFGKSASGEPLLAAAFAQAIARINPIVGNAIAVTYWEGGSTDLEGAVFDVADTVIHYGGQASLDDVRRRMPPHTRLLDHGPRISFGMIGREALGGPAASALADDVATAVATFDQQGCVSPHVLYVERGAALSPHNFAMTVAMAFERLNTRLPAGTLRPADAAAIRAARDNAEFRGLAGQTIDAIGPDDLSFTIVYDEAPAFAATCLNRTVTLHPVDRLEDVLPLIAPFAAVLQSVAIAADRDRIERLAPLLAGAGATRITSFRDLPWPPPEWHHDGRGPLRELIRFQDLEGPGTP